MKDITLRNPMQEKNDKIPQKCFNPERCCGNCLSIVSGERYPEIDVGFHPRAGASS
jgi:hypothetical protein